ncbi:hypothetical protein EVAR_95749_1 [Eumeta japonica]|uniref:Uncharacterized protein n=1 Tax=Eumeta variegata TaxID=151549 RepID=A0A4C1UKH0_EUMVA|nr:hypothetical protein EVAR_95749_1 [Eumeta japonica]
MLNVSWNANAIVYAPLPGGARLMDNSGRGRVANLRNRVYLISKEFDFPMFHRTTVRGFAGGAGARRVPYFLTIVSLGLGPDRVRGRRWAGGTRHHHYVHDDYAKRSSKGGSVSVFLVEALFYLTINEPPDSNDSQHDKSLTLSHKEVTGHLFCGVTFPQSEPFGI